MKEQWSYLNSKQILDERIFKIRRDRILNNNTRSEFDITVMESADAVNVIAITSDQKLIVAKQFRFGIKAITYELPGGLMEVGETPFETGERELLEETGFGASQFEYLGKTPSHPVFMNSYIHHVLAKDAILKNDTNFDEGEFVELIFVDLIDVPKLLKQGYFNHPHAIAALIKFI